MTARRTTKTRSVATPQLNGQARKDGHRSGDHQKQDEAGQRRSLAGLRGNPGFRNRRHVPVEWRRKSISAKTSDCEDPRARKRYENDRRFDLVKAL